MKLGSLFDGSGGFPLAGVLHGIEPVWASEIEPFPIRVTKLRFPNMKHLGSVTDMHGFGCLRAEGENRPSRPNHVVAAFMGGQGAKARSIAYCNDGSTPTLKSAPSGGNTVPDVVYPINTMVATRGGKDDMRTCFGIGEQNDPQFTLQAAHEHAVCYAIDQHQQDARFKLLEPEDPVPTLSAKMGTGGNNTPMILETSKAGADCLCIGNGQLHQISMARQSNTLDCMHDQQAVIYPGVGITSKENASNPQPGDPAPTISTDSRYYLVQTAKPARKYIVRRLTPTECARLQGFPDWWCDGADGSDSAQYKMWGNGIALPCAADVIGRIAEELRKDDEQKNAGMGL